VNLDPLLPRAFQGVSVHAASTTAGLLGRKSGRGFYTYAAAGSPTVVPDAQTCAEAGRDTPAGAQPSAVRPVWTVGVVGLGTMATSIVEVFAKVGSTYGTSPAATPE
jgi:3-hydroxyacyl-CoA dehydrogenase